VIDLQRNIEAREAMLGSIREHLAASAPYDSVHAEAAEETAPFLAVESLPLSDNGQAAPAQRNDTPSLIEMFVENLEAVGGHCVVAQSEPGIAQALIRIIADLQKTNLRARRIALSDALAVERLIRLVEVDVDEITVAPTTADLFDYDVGITTAQAAIAETGTLVLESECERHRLVSLVPPVHIAIVEAASIRLTLGEALAAVHSNGFAEMSPTITFITGPSRTADIELTLTIGVHGPQELYVIINEGPPLIT
jgi:L-lactate dehydrogenase complex protein LldG